jgi:hypothetical protein
MTFLKCFSRPNSLLYHLKITVGHAKNDIIHTAMLLYNDQKQAAGKTV